MNIKVALADDHPMIIEGLTNTLNATDNIKVAASYASASALLTGLKMALPDLLLLDMQLPDKPGNEVAIQIRKEYPDLPILVLSSWNSSVLVKEMMELGCKGYLLKNTATKSLLVEAIEKICITGKTFLDPSLQENLLSELVSSGRQAVPRLSKREIEILKLVVDNQSNQEIATKLYLSIRTVENHKYNLFQKLGVKSPVGLANVAIQLGLLR